jgi:hypothetical protein
MDGALPIHRIGRCVDEQSVSYAPRSTQRRIYDWVVYTGSATSSFLSMAT